MTNNSPSPQSEHALSVGQRLISIDLLRGVVMVVMVLDHVREFFGDINLNPTDLSKTTTALFFTRWITHFCAPVFVLLAGTGAYLSGAKKSRKQLAISLLRRGLILVLLEVTIIRFGMTFDLAAKFVPLTVIWAIGVSMMILAGLIYLPLPVIAGFGLALIFGHNAFDAYSPDPNSAWDLIWKVLHRPGLLGVVGGRSIFGLYPLVPWVGVMAVGYALGALYLYQPDSSKRRRILIGMGLAAIAGFVALRYANVYGNPRPWTVQDRPGFTLLSFLNLDKYPPSLLYLLMTLGPALVFLGLFDQGSCPVRRALATLGREPLFFYILQWYLIHILAIGVGLLMGQPVAWLLGNGPFNAPAGYGYSLPFVYLMWVVCVGLLYGPTAWVDRRRRQRRAIAAQKPPMPDTDEV